MAAATVVLWFAEQQLCSSPRSRQQHLQRCLPTHAVSFTTRCVASTCVSIAPQVVEKCHELGILHGDLKPANFVLSDRTRNPLFSNDINLLFGEPWLLAIDFGCSQYLGSQRFTKRTGTPGEQWGWGLVWEGQIVVQQCLAKSEAVAHRGAAINKLRNALNKYAVGQHKPSCAAAQRCGRAALCLLLLLQCTWLLRSLTATTTGRQTCGAWASCSTSCTRAASPTGGPTRSAGACVLGGCAGSLSLNASGARAAAVVCLLTVCVRVRALSAGVHVLPFAR